MRTATLTASLATCLLTAGSGVSAPPTGSSASQAAQAKPEQALVKQISENRYQIGLITLDKKSREISFKTQTNIVNPGTPIEFLLVHKNGEKIHESLLVTDIDPTNLNIALKLLHFKESNELFRQLKADHTLEDHYPVVDDATRKAARFSVDIQWKHEGKDQSAPITHWVQHRVTGKAMPLTPWVYNGSYVHKNKFKAKLTGNIVAIFPNESALANYPGNDREDDTLWIPAQRLPAEGTSVTVTIKPWTGKLLPQEAQLPQ